MGWLGRRDRRHGPRSPGAEREVRQLPSYLVERDAPPGPPLDPASRWHRRAVEFVKRVRVDAYPDHAQPFEDLEPAPSEPAPDEPLPPAIAERVPRPTRGRKVRLMVASGRRLREVHLEPFSLTRPDLWGWGFVATLRAAILEAIEDVTREEEGQGLFEYAVVLAFVVIVSVVVLAVIGSEIAVRLSTAGASI